MSDFDPLDADELLEDRGAKEATARLKTQQAESDLKWLMADPRGRRIARMVLEWGGIWRSSFTGDALGSAFREGERNIACRLLALVTQHCPDRLADMLTNEGEP